MTADNPQGQKLTAADFDEIREAYTGSRDDFEAIVEYDPDIFFDAQKWGWRDTVVRERIGKASRRLGLEVFN